MRIAADDPGHPQVVALLAEHLAGMRATSPVESVFTLDVAALRAPGVSFFAAWDDGGSDPALMGCAALRDLGDGRGEVKSMRTAAPYQRRGVARALLAHVVGFARHRGWRKLSLETGSGAAFAAAQALYHDFGFVDGARYGDYPDDGFLTFMHLDL